MNRDEFYAAVALADDARLRKILWTLYWRGDARLRERIQDELRPPGQPKVKPGNVVPDPDMVLADVSAFVKLARDGAYMYGDRRVHSTERSKWRITFRRLAGEAQAALQAENPGPAQQAVAEIVDLACETKSYDYFHSDDPMEAAKFVVSDAVAALWESVLRHDGFAAFTQRVPGQLIRWEADYGWTRRGYGQVPEKETALGVLLARTCGRRSRRPTSRRWTRSGGPPHPSHGSCTQVPISTRPRTNAGGGPRTSPYGMSCCSTTSGRARKMSCSTGSPRAPGWRGRSSLFCARVAERRGQRTRAAALMTECLKELPGHPSYLSFAAEIGMQLPPHARGPL